MSTVIDAEKIESIKKKLIPQNGNIIIIRDEVPKTNSSGLVLPNVHSGIRTMTGTVIISDDNDISEDTKLIFGSVCGVEFEVDGVKLTSLKKNEIIGKFVKGK